MSVLKRVFQDEKTIWIPTIFLMENEKNSLIFLFYEKEFKPAHSARDTEKVTFFP